ncbi:hypothetical protein QQP08_027477 [Theobroma cacao]|nr:hypothetical protein QQP08_027477 [Theobroma cacao]
MPTVEQVPEITSKLIQPHDSIVVVSLVPLSGWYSHTLEKTLLTFPFYRRFMKLRLDRVLSDSYEADSLEEALASNPTTLEFEKPENWVAPYPKYEFGWWEPFLPNAVKESKV